VSAPPLVAIGLADRGPQVACAPQLLGRTVRSRTRRQSCESALTVDCWIGVAQEEHRRGVRLAGRLAEAQGPEWLIACGEHTPLELDLSDLLSADAAGIEVLQRIRANGASFVGVPGYIQLQLESPSRRQRRSSTSE
jgi:hypothetical protein